MAPSSWPLAIICAERSKKIFFLSDLDMSMDLFSIFARAEWACLALECPFEGVEP
jgi:hypothetical protein